MGVLVVFGAVPIVYQIKLYAKRYRTRKMFEQDFANQIKLTGKPGEELMKPAISCNIIDMEDSSVEVHLIQLEATSCFKSLRNIFQLLIGVKFENFRHFSESSYSLLQ